MVTMVGAQEKALNDARNRRWFKKKILRDGRFPSNRGRAWRRSD